MSNALSQAEAALRFSVIIEQSKVLGGRFPGVVESLTGFDFNHSMSDSLSVAVDSASVDGDSSHPYVVDTAANQSAELARYAASLAFISQAGNEYVRPNRLRSESCLRGFANPNLPPVLLDPLRLEFCLDVMLYSYFFTEAMFMGVQPESSEIFGIETSPKKQIAGARHYLRGLAFAHAMRVVYPVERQVVLPVFPVLNFFDRESIDLLAASDIPAATPWRVGGEKSADVALEITRAVEYLSSVGHPPVFESLAVTNGSDTSSSPLCAVLSVIGGADVCMLTSGHTLRQAVSSVVLRDSKPKVFSSEGEDHSAGFSKSQIGVDPREIPDVVLCHGPVGGSHFFNACLSTGSELSLLSVGLAMRPLPYAVVDYARRAAVVARLPWLRRHLPNEAERSESLCRTSLSDQRVGSAISTPDLKILRAAVLSATALGIDAGRRGVEATVTGIDM